MIICLKPNYILNSLIITRMMYKIGIPTDKLMIK